MYELGGQVLSVSSGGASSAAKGESVADTAKTVSCYADIIAMRHPKVGRAAGCGDERFDSGDQRRRRRTQSSHPDLGRSADHLAGEGAVFRADHRPLRRFEIRAYRAFADRRAFALQRQPLYSDLAGGAEAAQLCKKRYFKRETGSPIPRPPILPLRCRSWTFFI